MINYSSTIPAEEVKKKTITFRKFKNFGPEKFFKNINLKVNPDTIIDNIVNVINQQIKMMLDEYVPLVTKTITTPTSSEHLPCWPSRKKNPDIATCLT